MPYISSSCASFLCDSPSLSLGQLRSQATRLCSAALQLREREHTHTVSASTHLLAQSSQQALCYSVHDNRIHDTSTKVASHIHDCIRGRVCLRCQTQHTRLAGVSLQHVKTA